MSYKRKERQEPPESIVTGYEARFGNSRPLYDFMRDRPADKQHQGFVCETNLTLAFQTFVDGVFELDPSKLVQSYMILNRKN